MPRTFTHEEEAAPLHRASRLISRLICRGCGEEGTIVANWSELTYGTATVIDHNVELDDYESHDTDDFTITRYTCSNCNIESRDFYGVALEVGEVFNEEE
jgi:hypothetical protein